MSDVNGQIPVNTLNGSTLPATVPSVPTGADLGAFVEVTVTNPQRIPLLTPTIGVNGGTTIEKYGQFAWN